MELLPARLAPFEAEAEEANFCTWYRSNVEELAHEGVTRCDERYELLLRRLWVEARRAEESASQFELIRKRELHARVFHALQRTTRYLRHGKGAESSESAAAAGHAPAAGPPPRGSKPQFAPSSACLPLTPLAEGPESSMEAEL